METECHRFLWDSVLPDGAPICPLHIGESRSGYAPRKDATEKTDYIRFLHPFRRPRLSFVVCSLPGTSLWRCFSSAAMRLPKSGPAMSVSRAPRAENRGDTARRRTRISSTAVAGFGAQYRISLPRVCQRAEASKPPRPSIFSPAWPPWCRSPEYLTRFHGVFAPHHRWRARIAPQRGDRTHSRTAHLVII
jgi:hypothetical protein